MAPSITSVTDDVLPVTGTLASGASTNDNNLTVKVSLTGSGAVAGDTVQLYNGSGTGSQLGTSYTLLASDITNGFANVQTGTLSDGTYTITARVTDKAGNQSAVSTNSFVETVDNTAPVAGTLSFVGLDDSGSSQTPAVTQDGTFSLALSGNSDANGSSVAYEVSTDGGATWSPTGASQTGLPMATICFTPWSPTRRATARPARRSRWSSTTRRQLSLLISSPGVIP